MTDKTLYEGKWLSVIERDGWYQFARIPGSTGGVSILIYRKDPEKPILGRFEICPAHGDGLSLTAISGGIEEGQTPKTTAFNESFEEAGYRLVDLIFLGKVKLSTNQDTDVYLFASNVTGFDREEAPGDGTKGEEGSYCDWVTIDEAVMSKSAILGSMIIRAQMKGLL